MLSLGSRSTRARALLVFVFFLSLLLLVQSHPACAESSSVRMDAGTLFYHNVTLPEEGDIHITMAVLEGPSVAVMVLNEENYTNFEMDPLWGYQRVGDFGQTYSLDNESTPILPAGKYVVIFDNSNLTCPWNPGPDLAVVLDYSIIVELGEITDPGYSDFLATWSNDHVNLMWTSPYSDSSAPILGFRILRDPDGGQFPILVGPEARSYEDWNVSIGGSYTYTVHAFNVHGRSDTYPCTVSIPSVPAPNAPTSLIAVMMGDYVQLNWTGSDDSSSSPLQYRAEFYIANSTPRNVVWWVLGFMYDSACSHQIHRSWFEPGNEYSFRMVAMGEGGDGPPSEEVELLVVFLPAQPSCVMDWGDGWADVRWGEIDDGGLPLTSFLLTKAWRTYESIYGGGDMIQPLGWENITLAGDATGFHDTNVSNGIVYIYTVRGVNSLGAGEMGGNPIRPGSPSIPLSLSATQVGGTVVLEWTRPTNDCGSPITHYILRVNRWSYGSYTVDGFRNFTIMGDVTRYEDTGALPYYIYDYHLVPCNDLGHEGMYYAWAECWVGTSGFRPDAPTNLSVEIGLGDYWNTNLYVNLTLQNPGAVTYCRIYYYEEGQTNPYTINVVASYASPEQRISLTMRWLQLVGGRTYHFYATVINDVGEGPGSEEVALGVFLVPGIPNDVTVTWGPSEAILAWSPPDEDGGYPITGYFLQRHHMDPGTYEYNRWLNITLGPETRSYTDTSLEAGLAYHYQLAAVNILGGGEPYGLDAKPGAPTAVLSLSIANGDGYVLLTWSVPATDGGSPILGYHVTWYDNTDYSGGSATVPAGTLVYNHTAVNGHVYTYSVKAYNNLGGDGPDCLEMVFGQPLALPGPIHGLQARWMLNETGLPVVILSWDPLNESDVGCQVNLFKTGGMFCKMTMGTAGTETSFTDDMVTANDTFTYYVFARNGDLKGPCSATVTITPLLPLDAPQSLLAVPGPGFVNLTWSAPAQAPVNFSGYSLYRGEGNSTPTLLAHLAPNALGYNDTAVQGGKEYVYFLRAEGERLGNATSPLHVRAGGLLASTTTAAAGVTWQLLLVLLAAAAICLGLWIYAPWKKVRKLLASVVVIGVAAAIVLAGSMMPVTTSSHQSMTGEAIFHAGDYFEYAMYAPNGIGTLTATVVRMGDTTMTWNFTYHIPGAAPMSSEETMPKNHSVGFATSMLNMSMGSMIGMMQVTSVCNETMATQWGYLTAEHRHLNSTFFGMDIAMDMWNIGEGVLRMEYGMSMMGMEMSMLILRLINTNMPEMLGGVG